MNYKSYPVGVHINENSVKVLGGIVQNDNGNLFQIQLYDGTAAFDFSGYSVINAAVIRPDETPIADIWTTVTAEQADAGEEAVLADETTEGEVESHTFLAIRYLDPENGRITLQVGGEATAQVGLHRMVLEIYCEGAVLTTARINYNVVETANKVNSSILEHSEGYAALQGLLSDCASFIEAERERGNQEAIRQDQEEARQESVTEMISQLNTYMSTINEALERAAAAAESAERYADLAEATSLDDFPQDLKDAVISANESIEGLSDLQTRVATLESKVEVLEGKAVLLDSSGHLSLPTVTDITIEDFFNGQHENVVAMNTSDGAVYVGLGNGYATVAHPFVAAAVAPTNTSRLWIDTSAGGQMKYFDGSNWVVIKSIAVFG